MREEKKIYGMVYMIQNKYQLEIIQNFPYEKVQATDIFRGKKKNMLNFTYWSRSPFIMIFILTY